MSSPGVALPATGTIVAPSAIAVDAAGDLFIGDYPTCQIFRLVDGTLITVAGTGVCGYGGDGGPATRAQLQFIHGIAVDSAGSLYIGELDCRVRRVSDGIITTVAGDGTCGYAGDGGPAKDAELDGPVAVATDAAGDLYISDDNNCRVRLVRGATITTVAGDGTCHFRGDGGPATEAGIEPAGVAVAYERLGCVIPEQEGSPPGCRTAEAPGTMVDAFPVIACGGTYKRPEDVRRSVDAVVRSRPVELYSVFRPTTRPPTIEWCSPTLARPTGTGSPSSLRTGGSQGSIRRAGPLLTRRGTYAS
jgi:hypothetical protein